MLLRFIKAMWTWVRGGMDLLPKFMIGLRHEVCEDCEHYRRGRIRNYCNECKCTLSKGRHPFNKLAHPCEGCPLGKWSNAGGYDCVEKIDTTALRPVRSSTDV